MSFTLSKNKISDTQTITNVISQEIEILNKNFRISAEKVESKNGHPIIVIKYHADSSNENTRKQERIFINELIQFLSSEYPTVKDFVVMGDFNECTYQYENQHMVLNPKLLDLVSEISPHIKQLGLAEKSILKQRGAVWNGEYLGPNLYINQQSLKDGIPVYDSKLMILHYDLNQPSAKDLYSEVKVPQQILNFDGDDTGGSDHPDVALNVHGIIFKTSGYMSTEGFKAFNKPSTLYKIDSLTHDILIAQIGCTIKLYNLLATHFEATSLPANPNASQVNSFLVNLNKIIDKNINKQKLLTASIEEWIQSKEFVVAQNFLKNPSLIHSEKLASIAASKEKGKIIDTIARELNGQPSGGYMPRVNGFDSLDNEDIKRLQINSTLKLIDSTDSNSESFIVHTEGCYSKDEKFTAELLDFISYKNTQLAQKKQNSSSFFQLELNSKNIDPLSAPQLESDVQSAVSRSFLS